MSLFDKLIEEWIVDDLIEDGKNSLVINMSEIIKKTELSFIKGGFLRNETDEIIEMIEEIKESFEGHFDGIIEEKMILVKKLIDEIEKEQIKFTKRPQTYIREKLKKV